MHIAHFGATARAIFIACLTLLWSPLLSAQSDTAGSTVISGYGDLLYQRDANAGTAKVDLERFVLFTGHRFSRTISLSSELEVEDAKVTGGESGGEIALEQAYVRFDIDSRHYIVAGLFLPRIGILNDNHLPVDFNGSERTIVETLLIPSTWREIGAGFYGSADAIPVRYFLAVVNGLDAGGFRHGSLIREGRFEGRNASANNIALAGALQVFAGPFSAQVSGYYGGSVGLSRREADSLGLAPGPFGTPVILTEGDIRYSSRGLSFKALGTVVSIPDAMQINRAFDNNTPSRAYGAYAEIGYNILQLFPACDERELTLFTRLETLNLDARIPSNGVQDGTLDQRHVVIGLTYLPDPGIVLKADIRLVHTGDQNPALLPIQGSGMPAYDHDNSMLNFGIGFSF